MDVFEAVDSRIACRQFFDKPVDPKIVKDLLARAARAASGGNLQSWNIYALTGKPLAEFKAIVQQRIAREDPRYAKTEYQVYPEPMFGAYKDRREEHGVQLYGSLGIDRSDPVARGAQFNKNFDFFDAPVALFITIDRRLGPGQWPISAAISMHWRFLPAATVSTPARRRPGRGSMTPSEIS